MDQNGNNQKFLVKAAEYFGEFFNKIFSLDSKYIIYEQRNGDCQKAVQTCTTLLRFCMLNLNETESSLDFWVDMALSNISLKLVLRLAVDENVSADGLRDIIAQLSEHKSLKDNFIKAMKYQYQFAEYVIDNCENGQGSNSPFSHIGVKIARYAGLKRYIFAPNKTKIMFADFYRRIIKEAVVFLRNGGYLVMEFGDGQAGPIIEIIKHNGRYNKWSIAKDYNKKDRVIILRNKEKIN